MPTHPFPITVISSPEPAMGKTIIAKAMAEADQALGYRVKVIDEDDIPNAEYIKNFFEPKRVKYTNEMSVEYDALIITAHSGFSHQSLEDLMNGPHRRISRFITIR